MKDAQDLLQTAHSAWTARLDVLQNRERFKRYTYGDQWSDLMDDGTGRIRTERDILHHVGRPPLTNNLIRRLVKTIVGRYRHLCAESGRYSSEPGSQDVANDLAELDSRLMEEFLISGMAIQRVARENRRGVTDVYVDNVNPRQFFCNTFSDPRGRDIELVGMLHDMSLPEVLARFGRGDHRVMERLKMIFQDADSRSFSLDLSNCTLDFFNAPSGRCRVIEVWTLEPRIAKRRTGSAVSFVWHCTWMSPAGNVLATYDSPWKHGGHPFVLRMYPLIDGEVHPFVEDVIDQQRYINRLIVLIDHIMGASAKGVLLFPVTQLYPGWGFEDVANRWAQPNGFIPITGQGPAPVQITNNGGDAGAGKMLELELKLFEDVSGVGDALMGKVAGGNGGSALFDSQITAATIALADIFDTFNSLTARRDQIMKNI